MRAFWLLVAGATAVAATASALVALNVIEIDFDSGNQGTSADIRNVPRMVNRSISRAGRLAADAGLQIEVTEVDELGCSDALGGPYVCRQSPKPGTDVEAGATVILFVPFAAKSDGLGGL